MRKSSVRLRVIAPPILAIAIFGALTVLYGRLSGSPWTLGQIALLVCAALFSVGVGWLVWIMTGLGRVESAGREASSLGRDGKLGTALWTEAPAGEGDASPGKDAWTNPVPPAEGEAGLRAVQLHLKTVLGRDRSLTARVLPSGADLDWNLFVDGVDRLAEQVDAAYRPDLVMGVNRGGIALANLVGWRNPQPPRGYCELKGDATSREVSFSFIPSELRKTPEECRVLVVDLMFKTGTSIHTVFNSVLAEKGFRKDYLSVATLILAERLEVPPTRGTQFLPMNGLQYRAHSGVPPTHSKWFPHLEFVAFVTAGYPRSPWQ
jgi:hypothetical protein